ncbi:MAG: hypothetical protein DBY32_03890 [Phascolarctobacterium sp.]|nr:MAG: hypothetical protein DBY32_03890 [Phascolarctobacterium sp.]
MQTVFAKGIAAFTFIAVIVQPVYYFTVAATGGAHSKYLFNGACLKIVYNILAADNIIAQRSCTAVMLAL